ncbi:MAG: LCP family protein [Propioniciclava sp.]
MEQSDNEDWLYRRGRYATPSGGSDPHPSAPAPENGYVSDARRGQAEPPPPHYGPPTPVGHYAAPGADPSPPLPPPPASVPPPPARPAARPAVAPPRGRRQRRRRPVRNLLVVLLLYLIGIPLVTWPYMPRTDASPDGDRPSLQPGEVIVLAGSDSREGLSEAERSELGTGSAEGRRADTIMLLYLPSAGDAALISLPRDSYLEIPGQGQNKLNAAYAYGGPELLVQTIESNTGLQVDGYAEIGFGGFVNAVDAVGGIEMCPENAIKDKASRLDIPAGCQQMDGITALGYVRMRKADPRGDIGRAERQREMLDSLAAKVMSPGTVLLPWRWWGVNYSMSRAITLGEGMGPFQLVGLGRAVVKMGTGSGQAFVVPLSRTDATTSAGSSVLWDEPEAGKLFETMRRGDSVNAFAD